MERYTNSELADMHLAYGAAGCNGRAAQRLYAERYPNRQIPCHAFFARVHQRLSTTGSFDGGRPERERSVRTPDNEEAVLNLVEDNPGLSTRDIARHVGISQPTAWRILRSQNLHPYHIQRVQLLREQDFGPRVEFSRWYLAMRSRDPRFVNSILFTDESTFSREGMWNAHNSHVWCDENPHETRSRAAQERFSVNVWAGILGDCLIGPYLLPERLTGGNYLIFLDQVLPQLLADAHVPVGSRRQMWFQHDGAPAHYTNDVRLHLNARYGQRWIGRGGPVHWPARSPDLTCLDFFLWGYLKAKVYHTPVSSAEELVARIVAAAGQIRDTPGIVGNTHSSMRRRCEACIMAQGRNFEHLL